jgi:GAF domain-containing protein
MALSTVDALVHENARLRREAEQRVLEIERRQRVAEGLRDLLAIVNSGHKLDEILAEVLAQSSRLLGNDAATVYLCDEPETGLLRARASMGMDVGSLAPQVRIGSPTTGLAVEQRRTLVCDDLRAALSTDLGLSSETLLEEADGFARVVRLPARTDPDLEQGEPRPRVRRLVDHFRAVVATPLMVPGRAFGAITLYYTEPREFSIEDVALARAFAEQATQAIENSRLHTEIEQRMVESDRRRRVAEGIRDVLASVNSSRSLDEMLDAVLTQATGLLDCDAGSVLLLDDSLELDQPALLTRASHALEPELLQTRLPVGSTITGMAVKEDRAIAVGDVLASPRAIPQFARHYRALLVAPLRVRGVVDGAITLLFGVHRYFLGLENVLSHVF